MQKHQYDPDWHMRFLLHPAFAFTLVAFATGMIRPAHDAHQTGMKGEFATLHLFPSPSWR
jgi:hypothetical protein